MSDGGFFNFESVPDNEGWTELPTGSDSGIEDVFVTPMQSVTDYSGGSGWNVDDFGKALQYGVDAYGKITAIQHGGSSQYMTPPGTGIAPPAPTDNLPATTGAAAPSTFMQKLTDFSTPVPYAVGLVGVFGLLMFVKVARR